VTGLTSHIINISLIIVLLPLLGSIIAGLFRVQIGRSGAHWVTIIPVFISCILSFYLLKLSLFNDVEAINQNLYTWAAIGNIKFYAGFLIDRLTILMMVVVTFVSLMVHIYTIGYMSDDSGYQRFFSYISLFTFAMLSLVTANNFLQLFFGWEGVGLVSYLLIGFYYNKDSALFASLKAFLINRIGDFGFILGIAAVFYVFKTLDYYEVFRNVESVVAQNQVFNFWYGDDFSVITVICILLFVGAMAKSAQAPLHVWLPDSMEGPTPISALIHAATMVTAGVFMVARMSPLFEYSETARSFILVIGGFTAFFLGVLGVVQNDIKRVIAYSTISQLGYMVVALGASAYAAGIFHLMTHAFFKALLFLAAGSVIIAMHHEQDIRKMGNLRKYMPITFITCLIGGLALSGIPFFSGFYSKDMIIEAVGESTIPGSGFAYYMVLLGVFVTALYTFRMIFLVFFTNERMDEHTKQGLKESPLVVWGPLVLLAIPSFIIGGLVIQSMLFGDYFKSAIFVLPKNNVLGMLSHEFHGSIRMALESVFHAPFWISIFGILTAWLCYVAFPAIPQFLSDKCYFVYYCLVNKYGFDTINEKYIMRFTTFLGKALDKYFDRKLIDSWLVDGSAYFINGLGSIFRKLQTGYIYHYAFLMIIGFMGLLYLLVL
tara:strand:- start:10095 stop:12071 length:1977 start_codon:yes stop_codon:yes gene_type:complete